LRLRGAAGTRDTPVYFQYVKPPQQHQGESLEPTATCRYDLTHAKVAELADAQDSGSCGLNTRGGSSPPFRTPATSRASTGTSTLRAVVVPQNPAGLSCPVVP